MNYFFHVEKKIEKWALPRFGPTPSMLPYFEGKNKILEKKKKKLYDIVGMDFVTLTFVKSNIWNLKKKKEKLVKFIVIKKSNIFPIFLY